ncbi:MAG: hypothetical protein MI923_29140 [Phycisphaerales bacterium]|nr:hypothetical protein [Phycisphaerales bacterium]
MTVKIGSDKENGEIGGTDRAVSIPTRGKIILGTREVKLTDASHPQDPGQAGPALWGVSQLALAGTLSVLNATACRIVFPCSRRYQNDDQSTGS